MKKKKIGSFSTDFIILPPAFLCYVKPYWYRLAGETISSSDKPDPQKNLHHQIIKSRSTLCLAFKPTNNNTTKYTVKFETKYLENKLGTNTWSTKTLQIFPPCLIGDKPAPKKCDLTFRCEFGHLHEEASSDNMKEADPRNRGHHFFESGQLSEEV